MTQENGRTFDADTENLANVAILADSHGERKSWCALNEHKPPGWWTSTYQYLRSFDNFMRFPAVKRMILSAVIVLALLAWLLRIRTIYLPPQGSEIRFSALRSATTNSTTLDSSSAGQSWTKPNTTQIIGFMYFGRRKTTEILECYLRNNLVSNGGFLDEIHFIVNTDDVEDLQYLAEIVGQVNEYKEVHVDGPKERTTAYEAMLRASVVRGALMVKLDDDLVSVWSGNQQFLC